ncbi:MAG: metal ABC transporter ATP-binding protein [Chloroflexota bacterium]
MVDSAISLVHVSAGYGARTALEDVTVSVPSGSMVALIGPNGSGKSTLLKVLLGLLRPTAGSVAVLGGDPVRTRSRIGYVPQTGSGDWRFPATVGEVVLMGRYPRLGLLRRPSGSDRAVAREALRLVDMDDRESSQVGELSGGQQQRVFLARALAQEPELLLLDEPLAGVDARTEQLVYDLLGDLTARGVTVILATHHLSDVVTHFDRAIFLNRRLVAEGQPGDVLTEENLRAAYGDHVALVQVGSRFFAVETGGHDRAGAAGVPHG